MAATHTPSCTSGPAPEPAPGRMRRTAVVVGVALACAVAIAAPFTLHVRDRDARSVTPTAEVSPHVVGTRDGLPVLLPGARGRAAGPAGVRTDGEVWTLRRDDASTAAESARFHLVVTGRGGSQTVAVPAGWAPVLLRRPARVGDLTQGVLVSQEGGDSDTWRVFVRWGGRVQPLHTRGPVPLGGGFTADGATAYLSWMTPDGRLFTRIGTARPGRFHLYAWVPGDASASRAPLLRARDLGVVCLDATRGTYGACVG